MKTEVYVYDEFGVEYRVVNAVAWRDRVLRAYTVGVVSISGDVLDSDAYSAMIRRASADGVLYAEYAISGADGVLYDEYAEEYTG